MGVTALSGLETFNEIINISDIVVIEFSVPWSEPCTVMSPFFEDLSERAGSEFYKVDVDQEGAIAEEVGISSFPTYIVFGRGKKVHELVYADPQQLEEMLQQFDIC
ncbi:hypothetical protein DTO271G3_7138 [Paecilomyces variotii]|nr:hypothetical protein DTO271G3_7138 [Paecilomyces variotii]